MCHTCPKVSLKSDTVAQLRGTWSIGYLQFQWMHWQCTCIKQGSFMSMQQSTGANVGSGVGADNYGFAQSLPMLLSFILYCRGWGY